MTPNEKVLIDQLLRWEAWATTWQAAALRKPHGFRTIKQREWVAESMRIESLMSVQARDRIDDKNPGTGAEVTC